MASLSVWFGFARRPPLLFGILVASVRHFEDFAFVAAVLEKAGVPQVLDPGLPFGQLFPGIGRKGLAPRLNRRAAKVLVEHHIAVAGHSRFQKSFAVRADLNFAQTAPENTNQVWDIVRRGQAGRR